MYVSNRPNAKTVSSTLLNAACLCVNEGMCTSNFVSHLGKVCAVSKGSGLSIASEEKFSVEQNAPAHHTGNYM